MLQQLCSDKYTETTTCLPSLLQELYHYFSLNAYSLHLKTNTVMAKALNAVLKKEKKGSVNCSLP